MGHCGVVGVSAQGRGGAPTIQRGLSALQHRGQSSAGIATSSHGTLYHRKGMGLVHETFGPALLDTLRGPVGIGHVSCFATASPNLENAEPIVFKIGEQDAAIALNGGVANFGLLRRRLTAVGAERFGGSVAAALGELIAIENRRTSDLTAAIRRAMHKMVGGYAGVLLVGHQVYAFRDPLGIRPLAVGSVEDGVAVASESRAIAAMDGTFFRDVAPGEILVLDKGHVLSSVGTVTVGRRAHCAFEWAYISSTESIVEGQLVYAAQKRIGESLAKEQPADVDMVVPVPNSARVHAEGFAEAAGFGHATDALNASRYAIKRTFILPNEAERRAAVSLKFTLVPGLVRGKRVVLVDDFLVRGTTLSHVVHLIRDAGATQVDVRLGCPPVRFPCYFGVETGAGNQLLAKDRDAVEIARVLEADSVGFLSLAGLSKAIGIQDSKLCLGCMTGFYPVRISRKGSERSKRPRSRDDDSPSTHSTFGQRGGE